MARNRHWKPPNSNPNLEKLAESFSAPESVTHKHHEGGSMTAHYRQIVIRTSAIAVGIPMDELSFSLFWSNLMAMDIMPWDTIITTSSTYLPDARNKIHDNFLEAEGATHLLMLDSDVLPPPDYIQRMLAHDKPIIGGWYKKKEKYPVKDVHGNVNTIQRPVVYDFELSDNKADWFRPRTDAGEGIEQVDGMGAGAWLMRRDVAEALGKSPYSMERGGEDLVICKKIKDLDIPMYVDWDCPLAHAGVFFV